MKKSTSAHISLFLVTIIWGMTFPLIKDAIITLSSAWFVTLRTVIAAIVFLPLLFIFRQKMSLPLLIGAFWLGIFQSGSYIAQTIGLQSISSANSAFITAFSVVLVPFIAMALKINRPTKFDILASVICLIGIFILTGADFKTASSGDLWTLLSALCYALFVVQLQQLSQRNPNPYLLASAQMLMSVPLPLIFAFGQPLNLHLNLITWLALLFCAIPATGLVFILQARYQKHTTVNKAVLIYAFEPIFATAFAYVLNHETIRITTVIGGMLVISGFLFSELFARGKK